MIGGRPFHSVCGPSFSRTVLWEPLGFGHCRIACARLGDVNLIAVRMNRDAGLYRLSSMYKSITRLGETDQQTLSGWRKMREWKRVCVTPWSRYELNNSGALRASRRVLRDRLSLTQAATPRLPVRSGVRTGLLSIQWRALGSRFGRIASGWKVAATGDSKSVRRLEKRSSWSPPHAITFPIYSQRMAACPTAKASAVIRSRTQWKLHLTMPAFRGGCETLIAMTLLPRSRPDRPGVD
jgi:hypothetical protein